MDAEPDEEKNPDAMTEDAENVENTPDTTAPQTPADNENGDNKEQGSEE